MKGILKQLREEIIEILNEDDELVVLIERRLSPRLHPLHRVPDITIPILTNKDNLHCGCCGKIDCAPFLGILPENKKAAE